MVALTDCSPIRCDGARGVPRAGGLEYVAAMALCTLHLARHGRLAAAANLWGLALGVCLLAPGCSSVLGLDDYSSHKQSLSDAGGGSDADAAPVAEASATCGLHAPSPTCAACRAQHCCQESQACGQVPDCLLLQTCLAQCGDDPDCPSLCGVQVARGVQAEQTADLDVCQRTHCATECPNDDVWLHASCSACANEHCAEPNRLLTDNMQGARYRACVDRCDPWFGPLINEARHSCGCDHGDASLSDTYDALNQCLAESCAQSCEGPDWSCVGGVQWPHAAADRLELTLQLAYTGTYRPTEQLSVRACPAADRDCSQPLVPALTTDAHGLVTFDLPRRTFFESQFVDYLDVVDPSGLAYDTLIYLVPPPVLPQTRVRVVAGRAQIDAAYVAMRVPRGEGRGAVGIELVSCSGRPAPQMQVQLSPAPEGAVYAYNQKGGSAVDPSATRTPEGSYNLPSVLNVPPGYYTLEARHADSDQVVSRVRIWVRANAVTFLRLAPTPLDE
jgi:hypothetical protein